MFATPKRRQSRYVAKLVKLFSAEYNPLKWNSCSEPYSDVEWFVFDYSSDEDDEYLPVVYLLRDNSPSHFYLAYVNGDSDIPKGDF